MAIIAVVAVPFIRSEDHVLFMESTMQSLRACRTTHTLDTIAIINQVNPATKARDWINRHFDYVEDNDVNILARAWNKGMMRGFERGADYCLIINLDLLFHPAHTENLIQFAVENPAAVIWSGETWPEEATLAQATLDGPPRDGMHGCAFLVDRRLLELVGPFDEGFDPAYFEDADIVYRAKLSHLPVRRTPAARFYHYENITLQTALLNREVPFVSSFRRAADRNAQRYIDKWGGMPGEEKFLTPFGAPGHSGEPR